MGAGRTGERGIFCFYTIYFKPGSLNLLKRLYESKNCTHDTGVMLMGIGFIGAGKVGTALGLYFKSHGLDISGYYSRTPASSVKAARLTGSKDFTAPEDLARSSRYCFYHRPGPGFRGH